MVWKRLPLVHTNNIYRLHSSFDPFIPHHKHTHTHTSNITPLTSSWWVWDGNGLFTWWQSPCNIRAHLLRGDVIVQNGLPSVLHGVQLVSVGVTGRRRLPWEHVRCWDIQMKTSMRGEKTAVLVLTSMVRICHSRVEQEMLLPNAWEQVEKPKHDVYQWDRSSAFKREPLLRTINFCVWRMNCFSCRPVCRKHGFRRELIHKFSRPRQSVATSHAFWVW